MTHIYFYDSPQAADELKELKRSEKERRLIESVYLIQLMVDFAFHNKKDEKDQYYGFFLSNGFIPKYIKAVYYEGLTLNKEDRRIFWRNFLIAKIDRGASYSDALIFAKLAVVINLDKNKIHPNSKWFEVRSSKSKQERYETLLARHGTMIDFAFCLRHLKGANAWVQDLDGVKTLKDDEKAPFEITAEQASELLSPFVKELESYTRLRLTIPQLKHEIALKVAQKASKIATALNCRKN